MLARYRLATELGGEHSEANLYADRPDLAPRYIEDASARARKEEIFDSNRFQSGVNVSTSL